MTSHAPYPYEAWLVCWGFWDITDKVEGERAAVLIARRYRLYRPSALHLTDREGRKFTIAYDPRSKRSWSRLGHATCLAGEPCSLLVCAERILRERLSDEFLPFDKIYKYK